MALFVFVKNKTVGVDIEYTRPLKNMMSIAESVLTMHEYRYLKARIGKARIRQFYKIWTRKEAYLKALGHGLYGDLKAVEVIQRAMLPMREKGVSVKQSPPKWIFYDIKYLPHKYCGALVVEGPVIPIRQFVANGTMICNTSKYVFDIRYINISRPKAGPRSSCAKCILEKGCTENDKGI
jgi:4'-phosphopantetheinyl transferase